MSGKVLYLKLLRLVQLFKSESEAKLLENVRYSQFVICLLFRERIFSNNKSFSYSGG